MNGRRSIVAAAFLATLVALASLGIGVPRATAADGCVGPADYCNPTTTTEPPPTTTTEPAPPPTTEPAPTTTSTTTTVAVTTPPTTVLSAVAPAAPEIVAVGDCDGPPLVRYGESNGTYRNIVSGNPVPPGLYWLEWATTYVIVWEPADGYVLADGAIGEWTIPSIPEPTCEPSTADRGTAVPVDPVSPPAATVDVPADRVSPPPPIVEPDRCPTNPNEPVGSPLCQSLPVTGTGTAMLAMVAGTLVLAGIAAWLVSRRSSSSDTAVAK